MDTIIRIKKTPSDEDYYPYETEIKIVDSGVIPTEPFVVTKEAVEVCLLLTV